MAARDTETFGALLRRHRLHAGLSQEALAERAQLSVRAVMYLERGARAPQPDTLSRLAAALALTPAQREELADAALAPIPADRGRTRNGCRRPRHRVPCHPGRCWSDESRSWRPCGSGSRRPWPGGAGSCCSAARRASARARWRRRSAARRSGRGRWC